LKVRTCLKTNKQFFHFWKQKKTWKISYLRTN
jgi:hypothetical protein